MIIPPFTHTKKYSLPLNFSFFLDIQVGENVDIFLKWYFMPPFLIFANIDNPGNKVVS